MRLPLFALIDRWLAPAPRPARVGWIGKNAYAHRGLHGAGVPENSPAAFAAAMERGLGIECDIQRTAADEAIVFHDWELDRLTNHTGPVAVHCAETLRTISLRENGEPILSLSAMLEQVAGRSPLLIEVKSKRDLPVASLCASVARCLDGYSGAHGVMSFDPRVARWFARHAPETIRGLVITEEGASGWRGAVRRHISLWRARPDFLAYDIRDLPSRFAAYQRQRGMPVATWTVRSSEQRALAQVHADAPIAEGDGIETLS